MNADKENRERTVLLMSPEKCSYIGYHCESCNLPCVHRGKRLQPKSDMEQPELKHETRFFHSVPTQLGH